MTGREERQKDVISTYRKGWDRVWRKIKNTKKIKKVKKEKS